MSKVEEVKNILKIINLDPKIVDGLKEQDRLIDIGLDSIATINLIVLLESKYGFEIQNEDLEFENYSTIENIIAILNKYES